MKQKDRKQGVIMLGLLILALVIVSCTSPETPPSTSGTPPTAPLTEDEKLLQQYPDGLDEAMKELEQLE